jgi:hypothetical protein
MIHFHIYKVVLLVVLLSVGSACTTPASTLPPEATQTSTPSPVPLIMVTPSVEPTIAASPTPVVTLPATPNIPGLSLPVGLAIHPSGASQIAYYDLHGGLLGELQTPNFGTGLYQLAHVSGPLAFTTGTGLPPVVYYAVENNGELWLNSNGELTLVKASPNMFSLVGITGYPDLAFSLAEYTDAGVRSMIFLGNPQTLPSSEMILDSTNSQSYAIKLLAISTNDHQPSGLWYTTVPYGIGGDIVFEPRSALYYFDLASSMSTIMLDLAKSPVGFSDDQAWVAYVANSGKGPVNVLHEFDSSTVKTFPLRDDSDRGAGDAVFSPDDRYVAWREAGGSYMDQPSTFHETIRIGTLDGNVVTEIPDTSLLAISGFTEIGSAVPVGWLDTQTLALEIKNLTGDNTAILKVGADGTGISVLATGSFISFIYP